MFMTVNMKNAPTAAVMGKGLGSDVALIKIDATDLPTVKIGKSSDLKVGEWVLAIGSPFGFDHTVTAGIVSAKGRNQSGGIMVNYLYDLAKIEENHEAFFDQGKIVASRTISRLLD